MKRILILYTFFLFANFCQSQNIRPLDNKIDSLQNLFQSTSSDSVKLKTAMELSNVLGNKAWITTNTGQFAMAYKTFRHAFDFWENLENIKLFEKAGLENKYWSELTNLTFNYGHLMGVTGNREERQFYYQKAYNIAKERDDALNTVFALTGLAFVHLKKNELDSARLKIEEAIAFPPELYNFGGYPEIKYIDGAIKLGFKQYEPALKAFEIGLLDASKKDYPVGIASNYLGLSETYRYLNNADSSYFFGKQFIKQLRRLREIQMFDIDIASAYHNLYEHFRYFNQPDSAFKYLELSQMERSVLTNKKIANMAAFQQLLLTRERELGNLKNENLSIQNTFRTYMFLIVLTVFFVIGIILLRAYRHKQNANLLLAGQKEELQSTLNQLKSTQAQLIQSEKMASLGELTAGIAHEIQNPLNFVNNFSEVSAELLEEMNDELDNRNFDEAISISLDLKQNLEKINHHGKRADAIVKGMLQHSRSNTGKKESTDINALCDEYLKLAYHGLRAKDKTFNATIATHFDSALPKVEVIPQELGRVMLNLINNAFYAVSEKSKVESQKTESNYEPKVTIITQLMSNDLLQIAIKDNGSGIPDSIKDKIFQPFFTTKPTGQGTGLGLSLAYDIITKGHSGKLEMKSKED
ncbi:MAG TPA: ATP-binding protein, partial [Saprospiraceae bacterium]|nr:ATP-binding protein [Saprospiraceae bacterium]